MKLFNRSERQIPKMDAALKGELLIFSRLIDAGRVRAVVTVKVW